MTAPSSFNRSSRKRTSVPTRKSGSASFRYHSTRAAVFERTFDSCGSASAAARHEVAALAGRTRAASQPTAIITNATDPAHTSAALNGTTASIARITPSCAEHGTPRARSSVASTRSFFVGRMRVVSVAIVSQPRPRTIGSTALR